MHAADEREHFLEAGYLHVPAVVAGAHLDKLRSEFDRVWELEGPPSSQEKLLKHTFFIELIEHPPILERVAAVFRRQTQLLQYDLLRQGPHSDRPVRAWHRDFAFACERPLSVNTILYLDDMTAERGPTYLVPGSHRREDGPPPDRENQPLDGEVAVHASAGDAVFINSAIWHSGGRNDTDGLRRAVYLYYGYWWLKRYQFDRPIPAEALRDASDVRRRLLGVTMPDQDLHMYDPAAPF